ncbi:hypothetical protein H8788_13445 [Parabacteroides faecis]|uniref:hypothetical protein n=1 Tax=Parabacteroides TaxID=375288 RepID=UPI000EFE29D5|nr:MULTISPECIES: hypothetical protein [Parabacteroides]MBC8618745.1 hypothetical protein [Parabacteroides faecis]RHR98607.1 hypothetical protein DWW23_10270 [Parabacteroides sp. AF14-59]
MKTLRKVIGYISLLLFCLQAPGQETDSVINKLTHYIRATDQFSQYIPREKVYLHFDNTSYYQGDNIWFNCYVVTSELHEATGLSKTLYVELLNPGGEIIDKRVLKVENGQCHGDFTLGQLPFYSGFYEVRAYTKYMLNFGEDAIFSRLLPVFNKPKTEGNYEEKDMLKYGYGKYPKKREKPQKGKKVNLKFYPEGGNLIENIPSRVAFEITDAFGNPLEATGKIINQDKEEIAGFAVTHDGRGFFNYTPNAGKRKAVVDYNGKKYQFDMPQPLPQGFTLQADNLSSSDSLEISLQKNEQTPAEMLGMVIICRGKLYNYCLANVLHNEPVRFKVDKTILPSGVSQIVLFNSNGDILCDRLIFIHKEEQLTIRSKAGKETYEPYEAVDMEFTVTDQNENPVQTSFSLSVRDGMNEVKSDCNILTDMLLASDIKGYVHNPSYYFEANDSVHRSSLDLLMMVQGWHRYSWKQMAGTKPFELKYTPEQGIEMHGQVVSFVRKKPKPNVTISSFLLKRGEEEEAASAFDIFTTDSLGHFAFRADITGKWNMILAVSEKGKKKDHRIILDRLFTPEPKRYRYPEMQVTVADQETEKAEETDAEEVPEIQEPEEDINAFLTAYEDSLAKAGNKEKVLRLDEVTVTAKKRSREKDIFNNRSKSIAFYDVQSEWDDITDQGKYIGKDIHELMINMNNNFRKTFSRQDEYLQYKGKMPLFVINYEPTMATEMDYNKYKLIRLEAIKSIYINEELSIMCKYADPRMSPLEVDDFYSCVVFIETFPEDKIPTDAGKGVRKTWLEGYSQVKEFYNPDYSILPPEPDYRRTLYWNPSVTPDEKGKADIRFYNNSSCKKFSISAETITADGIIGIYK